MHVTYRPPLGDLSYTLGSLSSVANAAFEYRVSTYKHRKFSAAFGRVGRARVSFKGVWSESSSASLSPSAMESNTMISTSRKSRRRPLVSKDSDADPSTSEAKESAVIYIGYGKNLSVSFLDRSIWPVVLSVEWGTWSSGRFLEPTGCLFGTDLVYTSRAV